MLRILRKIDAKGLTLVELMVALAIIATIAAIAIPYFFTPNREVSNSSSEAAAKDAYIVAQLYFNDYPSGLISSLETLKDMGFRQTKHVNVSITGTQDDLVITAYHNSGDKTYKIDHDGNMTVE